MRQGVRLILIGLISGLGLAICVTGMLSTMLFRLEATDPATFGQVAVVVALVSVLACAVPAVRVVKVRGASLRT
jgi:hypothetical protein